MVFLNIYNDGCNRLCRDERLFTQVPAGYHKRSPGVWVSKSGGSFYIEVPTSDPVDPDLEEE